MPRLTNKQTKLLELLDKQILNCKRCSLWNKPIPGGVRCKPYWTEYSKYVIVGEAPGREEVAQGAPFVGVAGRILWDAIGSVVNSSRMEFGIINSVNCRPTDGVRNLKPTQEQQLSCKQWTRKFIKIIEPEKMLILGNYAMAAMLGRSSGILRMNGVDGTLKEYDRLPYIVSIHPAYCIYNSDDGPGKLNEALINFKNLESKQVQLSFLDDRLFEI